MYSWLPRSIAVGLLLLFLGGCAAQKLIHQGDKLLAAGRHKEAIAKYEEALQLAPKSKSAQRGIREARRAAVREQLGRAKAALSQDKLPQALHLGLVARRMPLDLDDVDLVRGIDELVAQCAKLAEDKVKGWADQGQFIPAVQLADHIVQASPGVGSRAEWAKEIRARAVAYYAMLADELARAGLYGSAALQYAMARQAGADVDAAQVAELWNRFAEPTCFAEPKVQVDDKTSKASEMVKELSHAASAELEVLRARCGDGSRPLSVTVSLASLDVVDQTQKERAAKPLPGVKIATEEVYYEEEPYTATEQYTDYEVRKETQERRDCAPRPGKPRGCVTWTEEVEVKVPVTRTREVKKVRRIKKTRPIQGELPADKVVTYELTQVVRKVSVQGEIRVEGASLPFPFEVVEESKDVAHPEVRHPKMVLPADPMEALPLAKVMANATVAVSRKVADAVAGAVSEWSHKYAAEAKQQVVAGRMPQAEELYLKMLALGASSDADLTSFFIKRYGRKSDFVMGALAVALGRESSEVTEQEASLGRGSFPARRLPRKRSGAQPAAEAAKKPAAALPVRDQAGAADASASAPNQASEASSGAKARSGLSDEELKALEADSLSVEQNPPPSDEKKAAAVAEQPADEKGSNGTPTRRPVAPPK